jgi:hypothetical protein
MERTYHEHKVGIMPTERNIYMAADFLLKQHGSEAAGFAALNADSLLRRGDAVGRALWLRVIAAIKELETPASPKARAH